MTLEEDIVAALDGLFAGRLFPDVAPPMGQRPFCIYQQIGGTSPTTLCGNARRNARVQFSVWAETRVEASALMRSVADALWDSGVSGEVPLRAIPIGELMARYDDTTNLYGAQQDFSIWHAA